MLLKLVLLSSLSVSTLAQQPQPDDWWYDTDTGSNWGTSTYLASTNPYYNTYRQTARQMNTYGFAQHVGNICRGQFLNPELNMPRERAFGYQSDFNPRDFKSGAFHYKPQGQKFRAAQVHVNSGLASYVGEVRTMPIGQHVQEDGTILIQTNGGRSPCHPNPCRNVRMPMCTVVNGVTAKCSRAEDFKLTLNWEAPSGSEYKMMYLVLVPALHDGAKPIECSSTQDGEAEVQAWIYGGQDSACGVIPDEDEYDYAYEAHDPNRAEKIHTLTTLDDGSKYQDYTYQVIAEYGGSNGDEYLEEGKPQLIVEYDGEIKQVLTVPQDDGVVDHIDSDDEPYYYFFGCFRPQLGIVDTRGAGFYYYDVDYMNGRQIY